MMPCVSSELPCMVSGKHLFIRVLFLPENAKRAGNIELSQVPHMHMCMHTCIHILPNASSYIYVDMYIYAYNIQTDHDMTPFLSLMYFQRCGQSLRTSICPPGTDVLSVYVWIFSMLGSKNTVLAHYPSKFFKQYCPSHVLTTKSTANLKQIQTLPH